MSDIEINSELEGENNQNDKFFKRNILYSEKKMGRC